jgi:hypothetical protein
VEYTSSLSFTQTFKLFLNINMICKNAKPSFIVEIDIFLYVSFKSI